MKRRTKLEVYAYTNHGNMQLFAKAIRISYITLWNWINGKAKPSKQNAKMIEQFTKGEITAEYLRNLIKDGVL